jgi:23S rRNA (uridine2552-2'-O)-methyltransferase
LPERWVRERKQDAYYRLAKRTGYRSRAAFKLQQIASRYGVLRRGCVVVDLGCAPGGWSQVAREAVGEEGLVVGIDLARAAPLPGVRFLRADMALPETLEAVRAEIRGASSVSRGAARGKADVVLSDMSPNISGVYSVDQAKSVVLAGKALGAARALLRPGGHFVVKVFEGEDFHWLLTQVRTSFAYVKVYAPPATRKQSSEVYIVAKGYRGRDRRRHGPREEE